MKRHFKLATILGALMLVLFSASYTLAAPPTDKAGPQANGVGEGSLGVSGFWADNFDSYATGTDLNGVGGWEAWDGDPAATAFTDSAQAASTPNSVRIDPTSDLVHTYTGYTTGQWVYSGKMYIPTAYSGETYLIFLNNYAGTSSTWSAQLLFNSVNGLIESQEFAENPVSFVRGQWISWSLAVDLTANTQTFTYNGAVLYADQPWVATGTPNFGAIDLFGNGASPVYYDDLMFGPAGGTPTPTATMTMPPTETATATVPPTATTPPTAIELGTVETGSSGAGVLPFALIGLAIVAGLIVIRRR